MEAVRVAPAKDRSLPLGRDTIFISHANPEDNEFALWLSLQLAQQGYPVWCDLTRLLGGETFWDNIEQAIRHRTVKCLYILSTVSNVKDGSLRELHLAQSIGKKEHLTDFVIPLQIDGLSHGDVTIELQRVNSISFRDSWAKGLERLLKKLEDEKVPKNPSFSVDAVRTWWRTQFSADRNIVPEPETLISNWFPIDALPAKIFYHTLMRTRQGKVEADCTFLTYPSVQESISLISFAPAADFPESVGVSTVIVDSVEFETAQLLTGKGPPQSSKRLVELLRLTWERALTNRGFPVHEMANRAKCFYFQAGLVESNIVHFRFHDGAPSRRAMVGFKTIKNLRTGVSRKRFWHYGIEAKTFLTSSGAKFVLKPHVLFSDDGQTVWDDKDRLARARRNQCKNWWNDEWRDRLLAIAGHLSTGDDFVHLPVSRSGEIRFSRFPTMFSSPVSYLDPHIVQKGEEDFDRSYAYEDQDQLEEEEV